MTLADPCAPADRPRRVPTARATRRRSTILASAEALFAENGFEATRLEDVAETVGIRRASLVYYFRDKRALYDAVLADVIACLERALAGALESEEPLASRVEAAVGAWVDFLLARSTFARLLLREVASAPLDGSPAPLAAHLGGVEAAARSLFVELEKEGGSFPHAVDPAHFASAIAGATVFYAAALPSLAPGIGSERITSPLKDPHKRHRAEVVRIARRLLGDFELHADTEPS